MQASELEYDLPPELIAQTPPRERDGARMAVLDIGRGLVRHGHVLDLPTALRPSLFVVNDTRVLPARLHARKATQGKVEMLLVEPLDGTHDRRWSALARGVKSLRPGMKLTIDGAPLDAVVRALREHGEIELDLEPREGLTVREAIARAGQVPLPPYIRRDPSEDDLSRYQTIFANAEGSVAAPTAGLHFTPRLLEAMGRAGHAIARVTLHVGPGTFAPLRVESLDEHPMHAERYEVPEETSVAIARARGERRPIVAVGTTVCRTLEAASDESGAVRAGPGRTSIFIRPPYTMRVVDALFTNFHLPRSTLLALVMAMGGTEPVRRAYEECVRERYRFFSYGDAMLVRRASDRGDG
ncbi:MAG: tRNA preQ1(34) S-adenosylmethionine ribosyltransferase-isomerase QueA [Deltaproteobacteria bacterium]|nr:tRNA preQ1(34) S-adenosylmethionine ribosyltransferase-isomerase QueA [Deltaproteobacteria bacterium]